MWKGQAGAVGALLGSSQHTDVLPAPSQTPVHRKTPSELPVEKVISIPDQIFLLDFKPAFCNKGSFVPLWS